MNEKAAIPFGDLISDAEASRVITQEDALGRKVAAVIDELSASASIQFSEARKMLDQMEQATITSAAKAKAALEDHIRVVLEVKVKTADYRGAVEKLSADHARLVNLEVP